MPNAIFLTARAAKSTIRIVVGSACLAMENLTEVVYVALRTAVVLYKIAKLACLVSLTRVSNVTRASLIKTEYVFARPRIVTPAQLPVLSHAQPAQQTTTSTQRGCAMCVRWIAVMHAPLTLTRSAILALLPTALMKMVPSVGAPQPSTVKSALTVPLIVWPAPMPIVWTALLVLIFARSVKQSIRAA